MAFLELVSNYGIGISIFYIRCFFKEQSFSNGIVYVSDRGFDLFRAPDSRRVWLCCNSTVLVFDVSSSLLTRSDRKSVV